MNTKEKPALNPRTRKALEAKLAAYARLKRNLKNLITEHEEAVAQLRTQHDLKTSTMTKNLEVLEAECQAISEKHRPLVFGKNKSTKTPHVRHGFKTPAASLSYGEGRKADDVVAALQKQPKNSALARCVVLKPTLDKNALKKLPAGEIAKVGAKVEPGVESYFITPHKELPED